MLILIIMHIIIQMHTSAFEIRSGGGSGLNFLPVRIREVPEKFVKVRTLRSAAIDHDILIDRLQNYTGIQEQALRWFRLEIDRYIG